MTDDENIIRLRKLYARVDTEMPPPPAFGVRQKPPAPTSPRWLVGMAMAMVVVLATFASVQLSHRRRGVAATNGARVLVRDDRMVPMFLAGDVVDVRQESGAKLEDLVLVESPAPTRIRRVVGMPGDRVQLRNGALLNNDRMMGLTSDNREGGANSAEHIVAKNTVAVLPDDRRDMSGEGDWWMVSNRVLKPLRAWTVSTRLATVIEANSPLQFVSEPSAGVGSQRVIEKPLPVPGPLRYVVTDQRNGFVQVELHDQQTPGSTAWHAAKRGWILATAVKVDVVRERIEVDLLRHRLSVTFANGTSLVAQVAVGKVPTPTPRGRVQLVELRRRLDTAVFGPGELRTSGRSDVFPAYLGDDPYLIAIQGTNDPSSIGKAVTNGNIRVANDVWMKLATLPLGTPVIIR